MVVCECDSECAGAALGRPLAAWQALLLHRVLPSVGGLIVYVVLICFDLAIVVERYQNGDTGLATFTVVLIASPAVLGLVFTVGSPPPGLRVGDTSRDGAGDTAGDETGAGDGAGEVAGCASADWLWLLEQVASCLAFPVAAIGRYCHQIFWGVEAVCASRAGAGGRTECALRRLRQPAPTELYLFLQSFLHAAPHALVNIVLLMQGADIQDYDKFSLQAISIVASSLRMASTATVYRRFEREKICGRRYPWKVNDESAAENAANETIEENIKPTGAAENVYEAVAVRRAPAAAFGDMIQFSPTPDRDGEFFPSDSESDFLAPADAADVSSDDEYVRPRSIIERAAPRRPPYVVQEMRLTPPPSAPAPRLSLAAWAERLVAGAEALPEYLHAPARRRAPLEPAPPARAPRLRRSGLEPPDAAAALTHFLGWYMFFVARLLSISAFVCAHPVAAVVVLGAHYQAMLLLLIVPRASSVRRAFYVFLAFVYLFCLMEFKVRFRHVRAWHAGWLAVSAAQTVVFAGLWATLDNPLGAWWRDYVLLVIFGSTLLSYMCLLLHFVILKPAETVVYFDIPKKTET